MRLRRKKNEEEPGDLEELEDQYIPEAEHPEQATQESHQKKYIPRHKKVKGKDQEAVISEEQAVLPQAPLPPTGPAGVAEEAEQPGAPGAVEVPPQEPRPEPPSGPGETVKPEPEKPQEPGRPEDQEPSRVENGVPPEGGMPPGYGYYWIPPGMYPPPYPPQAFGYGGPPPEMPPPGMFYPVAGPGPYPPMSPPVEPGAFNEGMFVPAGVNEDFSLDELTAAGESHWRADLKWIFGIIATAFLFMTLLFAGYSRVSSRGAAQDIQVSLIQSVTKVEDSIDENYNELRSKARKDEDSVITVPDVGVDVQVSAEDVLSMDQAELTEAVIAEIQQTIYSQGYKGDLPMKYAQGPGEDRAKAVCVTCLGSLNKGAHDNLFIPIIICGGIFIIFFVLFVVFCRGWGKVIGSGILLICATLPVSLFLRLGGAFFWNSSSAALYEGAMYNALIDTGSLMVVFFDIVLGAGAIILLVGVVGGTIAGRRKKRVAPFMDLETPQDVVVGGPAVDSSPAVGEEPSEHEEY